MKFIILVLINALALWVTSLFLPQFNLSDELLGILLVALIFGLVNALIRPIVKLFSLPITCLTLGLFTLVINAGMLLLTAFLAGDLLSFEGGLLESLLVALVASILISLVSAIANWILPDKK
jgi:putative membrane protein